jgi:hypothetical protein
MSQPVAAGGEIPQKGLPLACFLVAVIIMFYRLYRVSIPS